MATVATKKPKKTLDPSAYSQIVQLRGQKKKLHKDVTDITAKAMKEDNRPLTVEERSSIDKMISAVADLDSKIEPLENLTVDIGENGDIQTEDGQDALQVAKRAIDACTILEQRMANFVHPSTKPEKRAFKLQHFGETKEERAHRERRASDDYMKLYTRMMSDYIPTAQLNQLPEVRAAQVDFDVKGGYLVMPEQLSSYLLKKVDDVVWYKKRATVTKLVGAQSLGIPTLDTNPSDSEWTTEIGSITEDDTPRYGKRTLQPFPFRKRLKVSERLLRMSMALQFLSPQGDEDTANGGGKYQDILMNRLAYMNGITQERAYHTGNGVNKPLGTYVASTRGISTARDFTVATSNALTYTQLVNAKFQLKAQYFRTAEWEFSRSMVAKLMTLVDTAGRPILNFQTIPNTPTYLLEHPINMSEYVPNTFTNGAYVGMLADWSFYHIADSLEFGVKMADQLYLENGLVGFFTFAETDGMPVQEEAFVRLAWAT